MIGQLKLRDAFLDRASRDAKEVFAFGFGEAPISLRDIRRDGSRGTVELIDEETVAALKLFGGGADGIREVDGFLVDEEFLEGECHKSLVRRRRDGLEVTDC